MISMKKVIKKCYVDTNILIFLQDENSRFYHQTRLLFNKLIEEEYKIYISSLIIDEYLYNLYRLIEGERADKLKILNFSLKKIFRIPHIGMINPSLETKRHIKVINLMKKYSLKPRDAYHLFIMKENKIKYLATFDNDFDQVFEKDSIKKLDIKPPFS